LEERTREIVVRIKNSGANCIIFLVEKRKLECLKIIDYRKDWITVAVAPNDKDYIDVDNRTTTEIEQPPTTTSVVNENAYEAFQTEPDNTEEIEDNLDSESNEDWASVALLKIGNIIEIHWVEELNSNTISPFE
jgi:hypothetical protein